MLSFLFSRRTRRALALLLAAVLVLSPLSALAETYYIEDGNITVTNNGNGQKVTQNGTDHVETGETVITNRDSLIASINTVTLNAGAGATVQVTVKDLHIQIDKYDRRAAVTTTGEGSVVIELDGSNDLIAGADYAGLQKENGGTLTIQDADNDGSLIAKGGDRGAGIGGGDDGAGTNITITGGTVTATGGEAGAGIGGGDDGAGTNITITGGTVTATGGVAGAGIGGGS